jgi:glutathione S-transferase
MLALYGHRFSSYTWKALIPLHANGTAFEFRDVDPGAQDGPANMDFVRKAHPAGKFPVLVDGETTVIEATSIAEYLAVHHPGEAPLIPADPAQAATARMMDRVFDNYVMGTAQLVVNAYLADAQNPDPQQVELGREGLKRAYTWLDAWLAENPLPPHVSLVTCAAAPSLFYADWIERIPSDCPRVAALREEVLALPAAARCVEDARPYRDYFPLGAPERD